MAGRFENFTPDYQIMSPDDMDELLFSPFDISLGKETRERIRRETENYEYYNGKQHENKYHELVNSRELEKDDISDDKDLDYMPTRYATNYFKTVIDRKARWQMSGEHKIHVPREKVDDEMETVQEGYVPSDKQRKENERADNYEDILKQLWKENKMRSKLIQAARDRLIADRVVCKLVFNQRTGHLRWIWRPDTEFVPIYSDDDFEEMVACHFLRQMIVYKNGEEVEAVRKQTFRMNDDMTDCSVEEYVFEADTLDVFEEITPETSMGIDFLPIVEFPVDQLLGESPGDGEVSQLREQNDVLNQMNEDAIDSIKFEMFSMTAVINAPEGTADQLRIAPGSVLEVSSPEEGMTPDVKKVEGGFRWKEAFKDQYERVKGAMHEVSGLPQIDPKDLDFGGVNSDALQVMFHDIISDTEEQWLSWGYGLKELHEKSLRYLQSRLLEDNFAYDKKKVRDVKDYKTEIKFQLPLPDNRKDKVELISDEVTNDFESKKGAMERLGVDNVQAKMAEIQSEKMEERDIEDPYRDEEEGEGDEDDDDEDDKTISTGSDEPDMGGIRGNEPLITCPKCNGSGKIASEDSGEMVTCPKCGGKGYIQERDR